jgi:S1-C subfamily serine protease
MKLPVVALLFCVPIVSSTAAETPVSSLDETCVVVRSFVGETRRGPMGFAMGSGFFVAKDHVLTCNHLMSVPSPFGVIRADRVAVELDSGEQKTARIVARDAGHDLALLKLEPQEDARPVRLAGFGLRKGDRVEIAGNFENCVRVTRGNMVAREVIEGFALSNAKVRSGFSGGPVFARDGTVQGLLSQRDDDNNSVFVRSDVILAFLRNYEKRSGRTLAEQKSPPAARRREPGRKPARRGNQAELQPALPANDGEIIAALPVRRASQNPRMPQAPRM